MPDDSLPPFPALEAQLKQLQQLRAAVDQEQLARLLCTSQQYLQCLPDPVSLQVMMQVMQTGVAMLHHLDRQLARLSPGGASPARGATAPAAPHAHEIRPGTSIAPKGDVVDTNTNASAVRKAMHRGINCTVCKGSVLAPASSPEDSTSRGSRQTVPRADTSSSACKSSWKWRSTSSTDVAFVLNCLQDRHHLRVPQHLCQLAIFPHGALRQGRFPSLAAVTFVLAILYGYR
jgi:hypothetical protein